MRGRIFILGLIFTLPLWVTAALASPKVGPDGSSLVLEGNTPRKAATSEDTLYHLLGKEVQVYIFNNKARIWPRVITLRPSPRYFSPMPNPQLDALINKYALAYGVDPSLVRAVMRHESGFNPGAVSPKGAQGLMQLMPGTAALMGVNNPFDPEQNIAGGVGYLRFCLDRFQHNVPLAVAAYNAGPEAVAKYCTIPPYAETQLFVQNVMGTYSGPYRLASLPAGRNAPGSGTKAAKAPGKKPSQVGNQENAPQEKPRPRPKVIEVRALKKPPARPPRAQIIKPVVKKESGETLP